MPTVNVVNVHSGNLGEVVTKLMALCLLQQEQLERLQEFVAEKFGEDLPGTPPVDEEALQRWGEVMMTPSLGLEDLFEPPTGPDDKSLRLVRSFERAE